MDDIEFLKQLLPPVISIPTHLRSHKEYKEWKGRVLPEYFPNEYNWLQQFSSGAQEIIYDLLDDEFPEDFRLEQRRIKREGWRYAAEFSLIVMEVIRQLDLTDTTLIVQRGKGYEENPVLVRSVLGEFIGRQIHAGISE